MNIAALASPFSPARIAGNGAAKTVPSASPVVSSASTVVTLSAEGRRASQGVGSANPADGNLLGLELLLPTRANVATLVRVAGEMINAKLDAAGISRTPSFDLAIEDVNSAHVTVKGDRPDAKAIEKLINSDSELQMALHNTYALASHIPALDKASAFSKDYAAAQSQAEIDQVLARYSDLLSGILPPTDIGLSFGKDGLMAKINGETVHT